VTAAPMSGGCDVGYLAGAVPAGAPLNFTAMGQSSTSVRLQWEPPATRHRNGEIVMYELLYHDRRDPTDDWPTNTTETSLVVDGLQPTTNYIFQIRAYTGKGPGPWSNQLPFQTFAAQRTSPPQCIRALLRYCTFAATENDRPPENGGLENDGQSFSSNLRHFPEPVISFGVC